mmetsp:Transcript_26944/g.72326  ORF Transcript_26944/g.72326 Transcript_26944/m.72326 type:complete len:275 (-) Transcript_26944:760-1584(-)|eukprot:CAMPEP_0119474822 /NCGR_PEP_ID=MMETSP1344-20130328/5928_1 /TAXON_ID=236787 /ORGANISM="Florenciella parvula, Strain CCMP2471" /LENGTH=274 /DNA_ID=CAMNT_0007508191 /DNA_START=199 /DNA_END=1023 /DNA_ORIENTATION=+
MSAMSARNSTRDGRWTQEEHDLFLRGMAIYGRRWTKVAEVVGTRTTVQVRSHAQKYEMKVEKDKCGAMPSNDGVAVDVESRPNAIVSPSTNSVARARAKSMSAIPASVRHNTPIQSHQLHSDSIRQQVCSSSVGGLSMMSQLGANGRSVSTPSHNLGLPIYSDTEITEWTDGLVNPGENEGNLVSEIMRYKPWNEGAASVSERHDGPPGEDLSSDQMALDGFLDGAADEMSPARLHSNSCEDEVMTYLDVHQDDDMINLGAADLAPQAYSNFGF